MPERPALIYCYDGSFEGLLCCMHESLQKDELPMDIMPQGADLPLLLPVRLIETDAECARNVRKAIPQKMGREAWTVIRHAFLSCHPQKELLMLCFLRQGFRYGPSVMNRLTDEEVAPLIKAVEYLEGEAALYRGFVRFSESRGALTARIEPKNIVLPLVARHFCDRYPGEQFLIHDRTHDMVLVHRRGRWAIASVEELQLPDPGEEELMFRSLWQLYYDTIEIKERHNPRCRMNLVPKRYWNCMTELAREVNAVDPFLPPSSPSKPRLPSAPDEV